MQAKWFVSGFSSASMIFALLAFLSLPGSAFADPSGQAKCDTGPSPCTGFPERVCTGTCSGTLSVTAGLLTIRVHVNANSCM